jgi:hypothetical protein
MPTRAMERKQQMSSTNSLPERLRRGGSHAAPCGNRLLVSDPVLGTFVALLCVAALWLITRRYPVIEDDALLYAAQALHALNPAKFDSDLYFKFGSQDQFTIFSYLYFPVIRQLGLARANIAMSVIGQALWLCGLTFFISGFFGSKRKLVAIVAIVAAFPAGYGFSQIFSYGECLVTPRLFAEAMILGAMGLLNRNRTILALALTSLSATLHPIMALPALAVIVLSIGLQRPAWLGLMIASATMLLIILVGADVPPFSRLLVSFDDEWFGIIKDRLQFALLLQWGALELWRVLAVAALIGLASAYSSPRERTFLRALSVVAVCGLTVTLIGGDVLRNVLIVNLQPWRAMWLATLVANIFVLPTFLRLSADKGSHRPYLICGFVLGSSLLMLSRLEARAEGLAAIILSGTCLLAIWDRLGLHLHPPIPRALTLGLTMGTAVVLVFWLVAAFLNAPSHLLLAISQLIVLFVAVGITLSLCFNPAVLRRGVLVLYGVIALGLISTAVYTWDGRQPWIRFVNADGPLPNGLASLFPDGAAVYWDASPDLMWLRFRRPEYFSRLQGTEVMFFRPAAVEYRRRLDSLLPLHPHDFRGYVARSSSLAQVNVAQVNADSVSPHPKLNADDLRNSCNRERQLDYITLLDKIGDVPARSWQFVPELAYAHKGDVEAATTEHDAMNFFIYDCRDLRAAGLAPPG